jgi:recombination protein RecA
MENINGILKKFTKYNIKSGNDVYYPNRLPTGIDTIDIITGGGYPTGRIIELYGSESVGKTLSVLKTIAINQKLGKTCAYIDAEQTFDYDWAKQQGVDLESLIIQQPFFAEETVDFIKELIQADVVDIIVLDSIEGVVPKKELESSAEDQQMAIKARIMNKAVRVWNSVLGVSERRPAIICINQMRMTMNQYDPTTTPGGMGMKYFSSIRIELSRGKTQKDSKTKEKQYVEVRARTDKNKTSIQGKYGYWTMYIGKDEIFPSGYCDCTEYVISKAKDIGLVENAGAWFYYDGEKYQGKTALVEFLYDNPELYKDFLSKIIVGDDSGHKVEISKAGEKPEQET